MSKSYPLWIEKVFFLGLVCLGIFAGITARPMFQALDYYSHGFVGYL